DLFGGDALEAAPYLGYGLLGLCERLRGGVGTFLQVLIGDLLALALQHLLPVGDILCHARVPRGQTSDLLPQRAVPATGLRQLLLGRAGAFARPGVGRLGRLFGRPQLGEVLPGPGVSRGTWTCFGLRARALFGLSTRAGLSCSSTGLWFLGGARVRLQASDQLGVLGP